MKNCVTTKTVSGLSAADPDTTIHKHVDISMEPNDESALTLNLVTTSEDTKEKKKISAKREKEERDVDEGTPLKKKRKKSEANAKPAAAGAGDEFISSLFNHNPDIPKLDLAQVSPLHEELFTARSFADVGIHPYLVQNLDQNLGIKEMTQVQMQSIPYILGGKDALIKSQTGSGKTLAYALPILHKLGEIRPKICRQDGTFALVIVPTRELATQSFEYFDKLCRSFAWIVPGLLSGGEKKKSEKARLRKGVNVLIATPGRLIDHIEHTERLSMKKLAFLVLDEADRMLELGYERDVQAIINTINEQMERASRQTLLLSATLTTGIEQLSEIAMTHPKFIDVAVKEQEQSLKTLATPEALKQTFLVVPAKLRLACLAAFILWKCKFSKSRKVLIFMSTQDMVDYHGELLDRCLNLTSSSGRENNKRKNMPLSEDAESLVNGLHTPAEKNVDDDDAIPFLRLHGSMQQKDRNEVFNRYRSATSGVLLCTDVAARGLDLPQVDWIVQYNPPTSKADYVHRVGRTARIGQKGSSLLFLLPSEANFVKELEGESLLLAEMTVDQILTRLHKNAEPSARTGRLPSSMEEAATDLQMRLENAVAGNEDLHTRACQAYVSYVRSYASYPKDVRHIFCFKELHLGHIAKSFALRDPPKKITGIGKGHWVQNDERKKEKMRQKSQMKDEERVIKAQKRRINQAALVMSEFASGLDGINLKIKEKKGGKRKALAVGGKKKKHATKDA